jgi:transcriptional regulator with XRE-family HTH domain
VTSDRQRRELAAFVRSRRERRQPEQVGLPAAGRRRTPGLRREEVATIAGVSVTWYTWLEQAREIKVSRQVLNSLVHPLGLDEVETAHLFRLAGEVPPADLPGGGSTLAPQYELLLAQLDPNPAYIVNRRFDVLAWNRGCELFYGDLSEIPPQDRNILWINFTFPEMRTLTDDWEREASNTVALFRAQVGENVLEPEVAELIERLSAASEDFRRLWQRKDLAPFVPVSRPMFHPKLGRVELEHVKMHPADDDKTIVAFLAPCGSELARQLAELLESHGQ